MRKFVIGGRFYGKEGDIVKLQDFVDRCLSVDPLKVFIAIKEEDDQSGVLNIQWPHNVEVYGVKPWGNFSPALNSILIESRSQISEGANVLFASTEVVLTKEILSNLDKHLSDDALVVGAALEGHAFVDGLSGNANGREIPWNTLALWNAQKLWPTSFLRIGDGIVGDEKSAGVEEYTAIAAAQHRLGSKHSLAKLLRISGVKWETSFDDPERQAKHESKMQSKVDRAAKQLEELGAAQPIVQHISLI